MAGRSWISSLAFRRCRDQLTQLSRLHWTVALGTDAMSARCGTADQSQFAVQTLKGSFSQNMLPLTNAQLLTWLPTALGRARLHLLLGCSALLESYLKDATFLHLAALGHVDGHMTLSPVGAAMGRPILERDSLPEPLKYAEALFGTAYGPHLEVWQRSYKLRCTLAHTGGVVTARTKRDIPDLKANLGEVLDLSWKDLKAALDSADQIATITDKKVATYPVRIIEVRRELSDLRDAKALPKRPQLWQVLHSRCGVQGITRKDKERLEREYYARK